MLDNYLLLLWKSQIPQRTRRKDTADIVILAEIDVGVEHTYHGHM